MTSDTKIAANRRNSRQSSGPRTAYGKLRVSRNALRHGLAAVTLRNPEIAADVDRLATAIASEQGDPAQREQALIIAESELSLLRVRAVRTNILEQMLATEGSSRGDRANAVLPGVIGGAYLDQLRRLERYERRAFSTRQRAIRILLDVLEVVFINRLLMDVDLAKQSQISEADQRSSADREHRKTNAYFFSTI